MKLNLISLVFTLAAIGSLLLALGAVVVLPIVLAHLGLENVTDASRNCSCVLVNCFDRSVERAILTEQTVELGSVVGVGLRSIDDISGATRSGIFHNET
jgi:hypothetical protein